MNRLTGRRLVYAFEALLMPVVKLSKVTIGNPKLIQGFIWQQHISYNFSFIIFTCATVIKPEEKYGSYFRHEAGISWKI